MKTPEEIKLGMECCQTIVRCTTCPYHDVGGTATECMQALFKDALELNDQLESRLAQVERERDAAEHDLHLLADGEGACNVCARFDEGYIPTPPHCRYACDDDCFRWRGVCAENTKEEK